MKIFLRLRKCRNTFCLNFLTANSFLYHLKHIFVKSFATFCLNFQHQIEYFLVRFRKGMISFKEVLLYLILTFTHTHTHTQWLLTFCYRCSTTKLMVVPSKEGGATIRAPCCDVILMTGLVVLLGTAVPGGTRYMLPVSTASSASEQVDERD